MNIVVIGGGASGLVASIVAGKNNKVTILERNNECGKKILVTGNGHCNYWHEFINKENYYSFYPNLEMLINEKNLTDTFIFLKELGIVPRVKNGYYYPYSNQASSVLEALKNEVAKRNVIVKNNVFVKNIIKENNEFIIKTNDRDYKAEKVIVATGGCAYPKSGSDGNFFKILKDLSFHINKPLPALVSLNCIKNIKDLNGVRAYGEISLYEDGVLKRKEEGEIQHTVTGISGICVMQLSGAIARGIDINKKEVVYINYVKDLARNKDEFLDFLYTQNKLGNDKTIKEILDQVLNYKLTNYFLKELKISNVKLKEINKNKLIELCENITSFELVIKSTNDFSSSQVTSGGVSLDDVNLNTLESKIIPNLYLCGEILDVCGDCGGYNLAFAFLSGYIAGRNEHNVND